MSLADAPTPGKLNPNFGGPADHISVWIRDTM